MLSDSVYNRKKSFHMLFCLFQVRITTALAINNSVTFKFFLLNFKSTACLTEPETADLNVTWDYSYGVCRTEGKDGTLTSDNVLGAS